MRDPRFRERVLQARSSLRDGREISIEKLQEKHTMKAQTVKVEE